VIRMALVLLLSGCASTVPPKFPVCPAPVSVPELAPNHATHGQVNQLEIRVELAREAERSRGNACAAAAAAMQRWIDLHP
jgi:hypothetical protein